LFIHNFFNKFLAFSKSSLLGLPYFANKFKRPIRIKSWAKAGGRLTGWIIRTKQAQVTQNVI